MRSFLLAAFAIACSVRFTDAVVRLPQIFGDHMVLQTNSEYGARSFIWGWAEPGEKVTVDAEGGPYQVTADEKGSWKLMLNPGGQGTKQSTITVAGESGPNVTFSDVHWGNVLLCSGQSNMERPVSYIYNASETIAEAAQYPNVRLFKVHAAPSDTPLDDVNGTWEINSPDTLPPFSAVCYLTALWMMRMHWGKTYVGLVQSDVGGTPIEAWTRAEALKLCQPDGLEENIAPLEEEEMDEASLPLRTPNSVLYNGMIHPLAGMTVRAALWYQGEANVGNSRALYACRLEAMIQSWRDVWGIGDFAFLVVQLAPWKTSPLVSEIRLAEVDVMPHPGCKVDTIGTAITIDLGDPDGGVHCHNKTEVGRRMALQLLHVALGWQPPRVNFSGPTFKSASLDSSGSVIIDLEYADGLFFNDTHGCQSQGGCCDTYKPVQVSPDPLSNTTAQWMDAVAKIMGTTLHVTPAMPLPSGSKIQAVRLEYASFPGCALFNEHLLPASPFLKSVNMSGAIGKSNQRHLQNRKVEYLRENAADLTYPPMGFNSWNFYHCNIDEQIVMKTADAFVKTGLADVGYKYVNIDDCWMVDRNPDGSLHPDPVRFPSGMKALADYVHSKGLFFGLYTAQAASTCQKRPGAYQHELQDAATYCEWGIDYLKIDHCGGDHYPQINTSWILFKQGFDKCKQQTGHSIVMSVESCHSVTGCGSYIANLANLWRTDGDIQANWKSILRNLDGNNDMASVAKVGHYNDPDMLQVGNAGLSQSEARAHFSLWNIIMAPLLAGNSIIDIDNESLAILGAPEVVAINKDSLGKQGVLVTPANSTGSEVWARQMSDGSVAAALLNRGEEETMITANYHDLGLTAGTSAAVRDLWQRKDLGQFKDQFAAKVPPHDVVLVRVTPSKFANL